MLEEEKREQEKYGREISKVNGRHQTTVSGNTQNKINTFNLVI